MRAALAVAALALLLCVPGARGQATYTGTITTTAGSNVTVPFHGQGCAGIVLSGAYTGSLALQQSNDNVLWQPADMLQQIKGQVTETSGSTGRFYTGGYAAEAIRINGPTATGTANVSITTSPLPCLMYVLNIPSALAGNGFFGGSAAATGTQTTIADSLDGFKQADAFVTWSGITGAPAGCTVAVQGSPNGATFSNAATPTAVTPGTPTSFSVVGGPLGLAVQAVYACGTYPTGGTISIALIYK